jgi:hypothetical protein
MTYDGALVMPRNCVRMTEDEMTYVEGGGLGKHWYNSVGAVGIALDVVIAVVSGGIAYASLTTLRKMIKNLSGAITRVVKAKMLSLLGTGVGGIIGTALDICFTITATSIGGLVAEGLDRADGKNDGYIFA